MKKLLLALSAVMCLSATNFALADNSEQRLSKPSAKCEECYWTLVKVTKTFYNPGTGKMETATWYEKEYRCVPACVVKPD
ncbi:hypothetical protein CS022_22070 [Veronia nyctiphanis]|uniref:Uncharacterized protein n=1 Tax=Veronia nyctiphanis TaxID=1278244 RepID=A0A4Q0YP18_9GAMM|nr:hypothetical protein [Veronia nyctiphanis]RXJ70871.1 hypothetical protein CS022_22070 [Veronia nyctiphanis]